MSAATECLWDFDPRDRWTVRCQHSGHMPIFMGIFRDVPGDRERTLASMLAHGKLTGSAKAEALELGRAAA